MAFPPSGETGKGATTKTIDKFTNFKLKGLTK